MNAAHGPATAPKSAPGPASAPESAPAAGRRLLDFRSGGWALLLAALLAAGVAIWLAPGLLRGRGAPVVPGDGVDPTTYGFDLSFCLIPREQIVAAGFPRDGLPALTEPAVLTVAEAQAYTAELKRAHSGKFLVAGDRVIGVTVNGVTRCYPLNVLNWHEVVNDTVGGVPILVTYNPLADAAVVFERTVAGQVLEFGVSGLLYNSNLLLYDRRPAAVPAASAAIEAMEAPPAERTPERTAERTPERPAPDTASTPASTPTTVSASTTASTSESLWSQLQFRAIAGPAAARGARLTVRPCELVHWSSWIQRHPETTVLAPDKRKRKLYKRTYEAYFGDDRLHFPIWPAPPHGAADDLPLKTRIFAVWDEQRWRAFKVSDRAHATNGAAPPLTLGARRFSLDYQGPPETIRLTPLDGGPLPPVVYAFWFGWYAMHPDIPLEALP